MHKKLAAGLTVSRFLIILLSTQFFNQLIATLLLATLPLASVVRTM